MAERQLHILAIAGGGREGAEFRIDALRTLRFLDLSSEKRKLQASECVVLPCIINKPKYLDISLLNIPLSVHPGWTKTLVAAWSSVMHCKKMPKI